MIRPGDFIVSYANTAHYVKGLQRLHRSLDRPEVGWNKGISLMLTTKLPDRCPPHSDHPYAFKAYMIADAISAGAKRILWADSSIICNGPLDEIFEIATREGAWISKNGWSNYQWTADSAYQYLYPGVPIEHAKEFNREVPHVVATTFCVDVGHRWGEWLFHEYLRLSTSGAFRGPWFNKNAPQHSLIPKSDRVYECGPADVLGHRHDQTALSVLAEQLNLPLTDPPAYFAYAGNQRSDTLLIADGGHSIAV